MSLSAQTHREPFEDGEERWPQDDARLQPAIIVDLDRDLLRTDLPREALSAYLLGHPLDALRHIARRRRGDGGLGSAAAGTVDVDVTSLPYRPDVLQRLLREHARGRRLLLTATRTAPWAEPVADHLGIFDAVIVDSEPDTGLRLSPSPEPKPGAALSLLLAMRPHQWLKNVLVLVALFTAQKVEHPLLALHAVEMFVAFCLVSSSVYVLNDLADLSADRRHATKRLRPIASGRVSVRSAWLLWPLLLSAGVGLAAVALPLSACLWLLAYYAGTLSYTFGAKRQPILDVIVLATLYTIRIIAGAAAISVPVSIWLLTFSMSIFTSLALVKRVSELTRVIESGGTLRGRGYEPRDLGTLKSLGVTASYAAVVVLALYVHDPMTARLYRTPSLLWMVVPILLYWTSRLWLLADRGEIDEDPVLFATRDRVSHLVLVATAVAFVAAKFIG